jgi:transcriptional regulator with XRE-family HTH domain
MRCPHCDGTGELVVDAKIGDMILAARKAKRLTQEQVSARAAISRAQIANIETGRTEPPISTLRRIAQAIGVPLRDLIP